MRRHVFKIVGSRLQSRFWSGRVWLVLPPLLFLGYFFFYPLGRILWVALAGSETNPVSSIWSTGRLVEALWFTLWQATLSTVLTLLAAWPLTWVMARYDFRGKSLLLAGITVPFVLPTVVVGAAFVSLGGDGQLWAILAAHVFYNLAVVVRTVSGLWSRLDPALLEQARVLGANNWRGFWRITFPLLRPAIWSASALVFLFTFTSFGVVLILGNFRWRTLEVEIYQSALTYLDLSAAAVLALVQLAMVTLLLVGYLRAQQRSAIPIGLTGIRGGLPRIPKGKVGWLARAALLTTLAAVSTPILAMLVRSTSQRGSGWRLLLDPPVGGPQPVTAISNSLLFTLTATVIAVALGTMAALYLGRSRSTSGGIDLLLMLPLGTSAVTIGYGFLLALGEPIDLRTSWWLVPAAHALVAIPFVIRTTTPVLAAIRPELRQAAAVLGASPGRIVRWIDLAIAWRSALVGAGLAAAVSLGEFGATSFIVRPNTITIPTMIFRLLGRPGPTNLAAAMTWAVILAVVTAALILAVDRSPAGKLGRF